MQQGVSAISGEMIVEDILDRFPQAVGVFLHRRMHCVGCPIARFETLAEACHIYRQPLDSMLADLAEVVPTGTRVDGGTDG